MPNWDKLQQLVGILADIAGFIGLIVSIYVFSVNRKNKKPYLTVGLDIDEIEVMFDDDGYPINPPTKFLFIDIANPTERRIKVQSVVMEIAKYVGPIKYGGVIQDYPDFVSKPELPTFIIPGDNLTLSTEMDDFEFWLRKVKHYDGNVKCRIKSRDATGNSYFGNWLKIEK